MLNKICVYFLKGKRCICICSIIKTERLLQSTIWILEKLDIGSIPIRNTVVKRAKNTFISSTLEERKYTARFLVDSESK